MREILRNLRLTMIIFVFLFLVLICSLFSRYDNCAVKGSTNYIYHLRGTNYYNTMLRYKCFSSIQEAEYTGYIPVKKTYIEARKN